MPDDVSVPAPMSKEAFINKLEEAGRVHTVEDLGAVVVTVHRRPRPQSALGQVISEAGWVPVKHTEPSGNEDVRERSVTWAPFTEVLK